MPGRLRTALTAFLFLVPVATLRAETIIKVTTTADDLAINGNCTLREAVIAANTDAAIDRCPAGYGADTILLSAGTYLLSWTGPNEDLAHTGDLDVAADLTIRGAGAATTVIDGGSFEEPLSDRVIHVVSSRVVLARVTIRGGLCFGGGGVLNAGSLLVWDSRIHDNIASERADFCRSPSGGGAGIFNQGELVISRSTVSRNWVHGYDGPDEVAFPGGGLRNRGRATIESSLFTGNFAAAGGGIRNEGELSVIDTLISGNGTRFWGGALHNMGSAALVQTTVTDNADGGILNGELGVGHGTLTLRNSTVSGNFNDRLCCSIYNYAGDIDVVSSTVAGNGSRNIDPAAGIGGDGSRVRLKNSIVSNSGYSDCSEPVVSLGHNLDSDGSCGLGLDELPMTDPSLGPLATNGGPTPTHALLANSPAIDRVPTAECSVATDQRGVARPESPKAGACDIGAYEWSPAGDIGLIIDDVQHLYWLTEEQKQGLLSWLKLALGDVVAGFPEHACLMLNSFTTNVLSYLADGILTPEAAQPILDGVQRVKSMICP